MKIERIPGQYPDLVHQRFIDHTGKSHLQIQCAFAAYRSWYLCILAVAVGSLTLDAMIWWNPYHQFEPLTKTISLLTTIGLLIVTWHKFAPCNEDKSVRNDYLRIGKTLKKIDGFSKPQIEDLMEQYHLSDTGGMRDARDQSHLSQGVHLLLTRYAFRTMAHEGRDKKQAEHWRTKFAQTFRVAVMLRLIPYWYETVESQQSSNAWGHYFNPKTTGEGRVPEMDWSIVNKQPVQA